MDENEWGSDSSVLVADRLCVCPSCIYSLCGSGIVKDKSAMWVRYRKWSKEWRHCAGFFLLEREFINIVWCLIEDSLGSSRPSLQSLWRDEFYRYWVMTGMRTPMAETCANTWPVTQIYEERKLPICFPGYLTGFFFSMVFFVGNHIINGMYYNQFSSTQKIKHNFLTMVTEHTII